MTDRKKPRGRSLILGGSLGVLLLMFCRPAPAPVKTTVVFPARIVGASGPDAIRIEATIAIDVRLEGLEVGADAGAAVAELAKHADKGATVLFVAGGSNGFAYLNSLFTTRRVAANIRIDGETETLSERMIRLGHAVPVSHARP